MKETIPWFQVRHAALNIIFEHAVFFLHRLIKHIGSLLIEWYFLIAKLAPISFYFLMEPFYFFVVSAHTNLRFARLGTRSVAITLEGGREFPAGVLSAVRRLRRGALTMFGTFCLHRGQIAGFLFISWKRMAQAALAQVCLAPSIGMAVMIKFFPVVDGKTVYTRRHRIDMIILLK